MRNISFSMFFLGLSSLIACIESGKADLPNSHSFCGEDTAVDTADTVDTGNADTGETRDTADTVDTGSQVDTGGDDTSSPDTGVVDTGVVDTGA